MSINKGDLVIIKKDKVMTSGWLAVSIGTKFIVNDVIILKCKCATKNIHDYIWTGNYGNTGNDIDYQCAQCSASMKKDKRILLAASYYDKLDPNKEFSTKYSMQIQLMRLLISKEITPEAYHKIMGMTEGDSELLELGNQILNKLSTHEL